MNNFFFIEKIKQDSKPLINQFYPILLLFLILKKQHNGLLKTNNKISLINDC